MGAADVRLMESVVEDLDDLDGAVQRQVIKGLIKLTDSPEQRGKPLGSNLGGNLTGFRSLKVGNRDHRIVFQVHDDGTLVVVLVVAARADDACYETAIARLRLHGEQQIRDLAVPLETVLRPRS